MCNRCSDSKKKYWLFGCGTFLLVLSLILGLLWPTLALQLLYSKLLLEENSLNYDMWIETPIPIYLEVTMFNWTNSDDVTTAKPLLKELGPYVFEEKHVRNNLEWFDNGTVSFNQTRTWHFLPDRSNGSLDDKITNLDVIAAAAGYAVRDHNNIFKMFANYMINRFNGGLVTTHTVREYLFDGFDDPLLDFLKLVNSPAMQIPFDLFGWFVDRNDSSSYDGRINMYTGVNDMSKLGYVNTWNNMSKVPYYRDGCGLINGTTGELWPPNIDPKKSVTVFATDICRSVTLTYDKDIEQHGITGSKWIGDDRVFDNGQKYPESSCFCTGTSSSCPDLLPGVLNVSDCRYGAPAFVSYPHFYLADPSYVDAVDGLAPNKEKHEFSMSLEPSTGIPLEVNARLQINILMQPISKINIFENVPKIMMPMFWFRQTVQLDENLASQAKIALLLPHLGVYVAYGIAVIGAILILIGIWITIRTPRNNHTEFKNEDENDDELRR